jgi:hypothetical protein
VSWQASVVTLQQGWESEAEKWARLARTPAADDWHETTNWPAVLELLPSPGRGTLDLACGEGRLTRLLRSLGHKAVERDPKNVRWQRVPIFLHMRAVKPA